MAWLLPGHGLRCRLPRGRMSDELVRCVERMKGIAMACAAM
jgi:hypothetical protein